MPELPEVETVRRVLEPQITGLQIEHVEAVRPEVIAHPSAEAFCRAAVGKKIAGMGRRGKFLRIFLDDGSEIDLHLRMTGSLLVCPKDYPREKYTHIVLHLSGEQELRFADMRRFGRFWLLAAGETDTYTGMDKLGPEPFDAAFTAGYLKSRCGSRKKAIKECLLDQGIVAGIGNIYADETLFAVKIHPARPANTLTDESWRQLAAAIPERLSYYIEKNTISPEDYLAGKGDDYRNTPYLQVYGHGGESCPACEATLERIVVGGRGTVFCPCCQKK